MRKQIFITLFSVLAFSDLVLGQLSFNAYVDFDYISTFRKEQIRPYSFEHSTVNQFSLNHAILGVRYIDTVAKVPFECAVALQGGDYVSANYASEPLLLRHVYDAYATIHVHKYVTLSAGIFGSCHLGPVSTKSIDNQNATFSMASDYSPYYMTGATVTFQKDEKFSCMIGVFNGYQRIKDNNRSLSPGFQVVWTPNAIVKFNLAGVIGNEANEGDSKELKMLFTPDVTFTISKQVKMIVAGQYGRDSSKAWYNALASVQVGITEKLKWSCRAEYFNDSQNALGLYPSGCSVGDVTANFDYWLSSRLLVRLEGRYYRSTKSMYTNSKKDAELLGIFLQFKI